MPTPIVMPQMGESVAEGTIVRWIKKVGDQVDRDEPLFEITTDKVDAEIPSPAAGILTEITAKEGDTVSVNSVVGTIQLADEEPASAGAAAPASARQAPQSARQEPASAREAPQSARPGPASAREAPQSARQDPASAKQAASTGAAKAAASTQSQGDGSASAGSTAPAPARQAPVDDDDNRRQRSSPLVRRIARENQVDVSQIAGTGLGGRVTKQDILEHLDRGQGARGQGEGLSQGSGSSGQESAPPAASDARADIQPLSAMRKKIAEHMVLSKRTSAHVHSVFHVDFSGVERIRQQKKEEYARLGAKLTYMAFIAKAVIDALRRYPIVNASLDGDNIVFRKDVNLGIAVALETGLIVPVIKNADEKNLLGLSRAIADVAERVRNKQLKPDEVHGGTFTITNPGQFGAQFGMPIINQPQVAILGVGTIEKRPVVIDEAIAIRTMAYLTLGFDHRLIDGAVADQFMADIKQHLEHFDPNQV
jgi:pyruvate dehydrogenase E2 component (dihydrolipoamide acetyltransferase)